MPGGQGLGGVALAGLLGAAPAQERPAGPDQLIELHPEGSYGRFIAAVAVQGAPLHRLMGRSDQQGPAARQPLQQGHPPVRQLGIHGDDLPGSGQLLGQGPQHGHPAGIAQGGSGAEQ